MTDPTQNGFDKPPAGWQSLVNEVQARIDAVDTAMTNLRIAVRYLTANAEREQMTPTVVVEMPAATEERPAFEATPIVEPVAAVQAEPEAAGPSAEQIAAEQEAAREEVRRAVEAARNEMAPASNFAWTMPRDVWPGSPTPEPTHSEDPARDEVRRAVEEAKAQLARGELEPLAPAHNLFEFETPAEHAATPEPAENTAPPIVAAVPEPAANVPAPPIAEGPSWTNFVEPAAYVPAPPAAEAPSWTNFVEPAAYVPAPPAAEASSWTNFVEPAAFAPTPPSEASSWTNFVEPATEVTEAPAPHMEFMRHDPVAPIWPADPAQPETIVEAPAPVSEVGHEDAAQPELDPEAQREAVRQAVERAKLEMQEGAIPADEPDAADEAAAREEVRKAVAAMRNEMNWGSSPHVSFDSPNNGHSADPDDPDGKREEVRRVVENARAEMNFGVGGLSMYDETAPREVDGLKPEETQSLFAAFAGAESSATAWHRSESDFTGMPPSIIIEDAEGRVELARVYDTLNRVDRSQAALLNYSPHSVTVGLAAREHLPEPEVMIAAVRDAFGRGCKVTTEGVKMSVKIGEGEKAA